MGSRGGRPAVGLSGTAATSTILTAFMRDVLVLMRELELPLLGVSIAAFALSGLAGRYELKPALVRDLAVLGTVTGLAFLSFVLILSVVAPTGCEGLSARECYDR